MTSDKLNSFGLCIVLKTISFIEKLPFRPYWLCYKPVKPGHYAYLLLTEFEGRTVNYSPRFSS